MPSQEILKIRDVARILVFKIRPSQEILKIRDGTPLEAEGILTYRKSPRNFSVWHFSSKPSQETLKIRDGTPLEAEGILTYRKVLETARPSQEILKIRDEILKIRDEILKIRDEILKIRDEILKIRDAVPSNVVQKKRVARILVFKIRPSQEILKIRDGTPLEAEGILTYRKSPRNFSVWHFSSKLDVPSNVVQKKRVSLILVFKIRPSQEILKIRDGTPLEAEGILTYRKRPSKLIGHLKKFKKFVMVPLWRRKEFWHTEKSPRNCSVWHFSSKLDVPSNVVQKKRVARILVFKIRPSQEILKIRDGTPLEAEGILTYRKSPRNCSVWHFSSKLDVPSNVVQNKRVARIRVFKIRPSQEILKIRDGTPLETEGILTYRKRPSKLIEILKIRDGTPLEWPSQEILKIRDGTPLEAEGILTYRKKPSQEILKIHDGTPLELPSQEILKIRDGTPLEAEGILTYRKKTLKIRDGTPLEAEGILTYRKVLETARPSQEILKIRDVARILVFKISPSQEILKIRDGTPLEIFKIRPSQEILKIRDGTPLEWPSQEILKIHDVQKKRVARILVFKIRPSQEILKIRDGTPLEAEGILTYRKSPRNFSVWHFSSKLDVPSNVVQKKRVSRILVFKIRPSQEILKIRDGTPLEAEGILTYRKRPSKLIDVPSNVVQKKRVARILVFKIRPSQEIQKIRDGTPLEAEGILAYRKKPSKLSVWHFSSKLDVPSNVVQKKRVARILVFKIRPSQEILKIRDALEAEGILTYRKSPRNCSVWHFSSKLDVPSNVVQNKRVARIRVFKIRPSQEILKIRDGTPLETQGILTYRKRPSKLIGLALI
ncbi:hypothetical protein OROHE_011726 [Orobanche hederae]